MVVKSKLSRNVFEIVDTLLFTLSSLPSTESSEGTLSEDVVSEAKYSAASKLFTRAIKSKTKQSNYVQSRRAPLNLIAKRFANECSNMTADQKAEMVKYLSDYSLSYLKQGEDFFSSIAKSIHDKKESFKIIQKEMKSMGVSLEHLKQTGKK